MKKALKLFLRFVVGVAVLLAVIFGFFTFFGKSTALETGRLKDWKNASLERRLAAAKVLTASDSNLDLLVACVDKVASLPDSADMPVRDATELCFMGIKLKDNI